jgi:hypothetical protein
VLSYFNTQLREDTDMRFVLECYEIIEEAAAKRAMKAGHGKSKPKGRR